MSKKTEEESDRVGSRYNQTLYISNESIETGMNMSNIHSIMLKSFKINQEWNEVKDVTNENLNVHTTTHPDIVIG